MVDESARRVSRVRPLLIAMDVSIRYSTRLSMSGSIASYGSAAHLGTLCSVLHALERANAGSPTDTRGDSDDRFNAQRHESRW
jgi:hypothetical protein